MGNPDTAAGDRAMLRTFYAADVHGSEVCWRKFLNAGPFHKADVLILGGDMTGKAIVPIVDTGGGWETMLQDHHFAMETEDEIQAMEKRIINRGYYPVPGSRDQLAAVETDPQPGDRTFQ